MSVLLVDDETDLLEIGKIFLEDSGDFIVDPVISASLALENLKQNHYDAIVSDYEMPVMDGIAFLKTLKSEGSDIPFIIFTGRGREHVAMEALNNGAAFYLQKGMDTKSQFAELKNMIAQAVKRKTAEEELLKSEERYRAVVETQTELITRFLPDKMHIFANEAYTRYFGLKNEEIIGHQFTPDIPVEDKPRVREHFRSLSPENPVGTIEHRIILPGGEVRWHEYTDRALFNGNGNTVEYQSVGRDITERRWGEEKISYLASFTDMNPNPVIELGRNREICYVNPATATFFPDYHRLGANHPLFYNLPELLEEANARGMKSLVRKMKIGESWFEETVLWSDSSTEKKRMAIYVNKISEIPMGEFVSLPGAD
ncbi:MAG: response regulator [Methanomicrobiales archaeon]